MAQKDDCMEIYSHSAETIGSQYQYIFKGPFAPELDSSLV